jgi:hypothetical protein
MPRRFWACTIITTISALMSAGFSVAAVLVWSDTGISLIPSESAYYI